MLVFITQVGIPGQIPPIYLDYLIVRVLLILVDSLGVLCIYPADIPDLIFIYPVPSPLDLLRLVLVLAIWAVLRALE